MPVGPTPVAPVRAVLLQATLSNSSASQFAVMVPEAVAVTAMVVPLRPPVQEACRVACASLWHLDSSCSCRSPVVAQVPRRRAALTDLLSLPAARIPRAARPCLPWHARHNHRPLRPPPDVLDTALHLGQAASAVLVARIGMTAPSWKHCAAARLRSSARRSTSLVKTMMR